jgi:hypothetical protein
METSERKVRSDKGRVRIKLPAEWLALRREIRGLRKALAEANGRENVLQGELGRRTGSLAAVLEWAGKLVSDRAYLERHFRNSSRRWLQRHPIGQCIQSALRHNPGQSDSAPDEQADDGQGEQHDGGS